eukprot:1358400-Rhodomonas_salina.1
MPARSSSSHPPVASASASDRRVHTILVVHPGIKYKIKYKITHSWYNLSSDRVFPPLISQHRLRENVAPLWSMNFNPSEQRLSEI